MMGSLPLFLFLSVGSIALFSFVAVAAWSDARRREREAYYKSETLKKIAEAQGLGPVPRSSFSARKQSGGRSKRRTQPGANERASNWAAWSRLRLALH